MTDKWRLAKVVSKWPWPLEFHRVWIKCISISESTTAPEKCTFSVFPLQNLKHQIWYCCKVRPGQLKVIIYINFVELSPQMLDTRFQGNCPSGTGEGDFLGFKYIWACGHLGHVTWIKYINLLSPLPWGCMWALHGIGLVVSEEKSFENVDRWRARSRLINHLDLKNFLIWMHFHIRGHKSTRKSTFSVFPSQSLREQIWPCHKISQGHTRVFICLNFSELPPLPSKRYKPNFKARKISRRRTTKVFTIYWYGSHLGHTTWAKYMNFLSLFARRLHMKFNLNRFSSFKEEVL